MMQTTRKLSEKVLSELNLDPKRFPEKMMLGAVSTAKQSYSSGRLSRRQLYRRENQAVL